MGCSGDSSQKCGGSYRLSLYQKTTPANTTASTPSIPAGWTYSCITTCNVQGFSYGGPQYGNQCWCGNTLSNGLGVSASPSDCNVPCAGNSKQMCGGSYRFSLFKKGAVNTPTTTTTSTTTTSTTTTASSTTTTATATTTTATTTATTSTATGTFSTLPAGWTYVGCATDGPARALGYSFQSSALTQESCVATCNSLGYTFSGPQYSNQCYCGNSLANGLGLSAASSDCNSPCAGNSKEMCGGSYRFSLFQKTSATTTTGTSAATSTSLSIPAGWTYVGCATDGPARALGYSFESSSLTQESCVTTCNILGYTFGGPQYSNQCYCGNSLANGLGVSASSSECNSPCSGNSSQICGGSYRFSLFQKNSTPPAATVPTTTTTTATTPTFSPAASATALGWTLSRPCAVDTSAGILQGYTYSSSSIMTPQACQLTCALKGYHIAGIENGSDCYCGNAYVGGTPANAATSDCNVACSGASSSSCGGSSRMVVYTNTVASLGEMWQTTWDKSKLLAPLSISPIPFTTVGSIADADITVDETKTYQTMDGFGASLTDSSAKLFASLKVKNSASYYTLLHQLFDVGDGAQSAMNGVLRVPLGATDFSDTTWSYCDTNDPSFASFNINAAPPAVWDVLYDILALNPLLKIYVVPWSPPAWMKTSGTMLGGSLNPNPTYLLKALQGFRSKGIPVYAIGIQNEPEYSDTSYPSTLMPALRPLMNSNGFTAVKLIGYEHNFNDAAGYPVQLMNAASHRTPIESFRSAWPQKEVHLTECSGVYGSDWWGDVKWLTDNLFVGGPEHFGKSSMMWNLALDGNGLPKFPGSKSCGTPCRGVVQINADGTWSLNQEYFPIAHAGKAIAAKDAVSAYATPRLSPSDKTRYSLVVLNWRDYASSGMNPTPQTTTINFRGVQATYTFPVGLTTLSWYA
ncbi:glycoside hydrolase superfamily [Roridomyces roridus]|uniref:Glycoside hydrolase superfamily n=1 Tax=Roridomyces roridus TaxID=1738132 RepID=A0AAD7BXE8_9AGAR|nr:glycoside hydrolase superfamily [Roridomyces roridus]